MYTIEQICESVSSCMSESDRLAKYKHLPMPGGCCYVASEAVYHLNKEVGPNHTLVPYRIMVGDISHWYLRDLHTTTLLAEGGVIDLTSEQFTGVTLDYRFHRPNRFLTVEPSRRARVLIARCKNFLAHRKQFEICPPEMVDKQ